MQFKTFRDTGDIIMVGDSVVEILLQTAANRGGVTHDAAKAKWGVKEGGCILLDNIAFEAMDFARASILQFNCDSVERRCIAESSW